MLDSFEWNDRFTILCNSMLRYTLTFCLELVNFELFLKPRVNVTMKSSINLQET